MMRFHKMSNISHKNDEIVEFFAKGLQKLL